MWQAISQQLSETLMFTFEIAEKTKVSGGDINECYMISDGEQRYFVKVNSREFLPKFEIEAENIRMLRESNTVFVPELIFTGHSKDNAFIVLNYLPTKPLDDDKNSYLFGQQLAKLHQWGEQKEFGFDQDNYIGSTLQPNKWERKWARFFAEQRIGWQLQLVQEKGVNLVDINDFTEIIHAHLAGHQPRPSLLHSDSASGTGCKYLCARRIYSREEECSHSLDKTPAETHQTILSSRYRIRGRPSSMPDRSRLDQIPN